MPGPTLATMARSLRADEERLARVRRLLPTVGGAGLVGVAETAARALATGAAQVSLLADARTVAAVAGDAHAPAGHRAPLDQVLCTVPAAAGAALAVPDARADARFRDLPPVAAGGVRSYLGVPLVGADGHVLGTLCVHAPEVRRWSARETDVLHDLATTTVAELERAARDLDARVEQRRRELAAAASGTGTVDWDPVTGRLAADDRALALVDLERGDLDGGAEAVAARLHPEDAARARDLVHRAVATCGEIAGDCRVVHRDGTVRWLQVRGACVPGPAGTTVRVVGVVSDTTAEHDADARVARVLETMPAAFALLDDAWRFRHVNGAAGRLLGVPPDELVGALLWDAFPGARRTELGAALRTAARTGRDQHLETYLPGRRAGWYEVRVWPGPDGLSVYAQDVTTRVRAQRTTVRAHRHARRALRSVERHARGLALLAAVRDDLGATFDVEEGVVRFARRLVPALGSWCVVTLADERGALRDAACWHDDPALRATVARYAALRQPALSPEAFLRRALRTGRPVVVEDAATAGGAVLSGEARDLLHALGPRTAYLVPMRARERTVGVLSLYLDPGRPDLEADEVATLTQLADRAGLMLDNARLYAEQRHIAETLQRSLLSDPVQPPGARVATRYVAAAAAAQVGGDWYDAFDQDGAGSVLVVGDVMGHDTRATAAMSQVRTLLRGIAHSTGLPPAALLRRLDHALADLDVRAVATAVVLRLEPATGEHPVRLRWANAGHLPPVLVAPDGQVTELHAAQPELVLGLVPGTERRGAVTTLPADAVLLLYTDGLVERRGEDLRTGLARLRQVVADLVAEAGGAPHVDPDALVDGVLARMLPGGRADDDVAVLAVRIRPTGR